MMHQGMPKRIEYIENGTTTIYEHSINSEYPAIPSIKEVSGVLVVYLDP
jgi:hypothetical protein